jgi:hypothetical protein
MAVRPNIELHIEELVLHGFPPSARHAVAESIRTALESRLAGEGLPDTREASVKRVVGETIHDAVWPPK